MAEPFDVGARMGELLAGGGTPPAAPSPSGTAAAAPFNVVDAMRDQVGTFVARRDAQDAHRAASAVALSPALSPEQQRISEELTAQGRPASAEFISQDTPRFTAEFELARALKIYADAPLTARWAAMADNAAFVRRDAEHLALIEKFFADPSAIAYIAAGPLALLQSVPAVLGSAARGLAPIAERADEASIRRHVTSASGDLLTMAMGAGSDTPEARDRIAKRLFSLSLLLQGTQSGVGGPLADVARALSEGAPLDDVRAQLAAIDVSAIAVDAPDRAATVVGDWIGSRLQETLAPAVGTEGAFWTEMGATVGSLATFMGVSALSGGTLTFPMAASIGVDEAYQRARGHGLSHDEAMKHAMLGSIPGAIQAFSVEFIMRALPGIARRRLGAALRDMGETAAAEAIVEGLGALGQNLIEQRYNPEASAFDGVIKQGLMGGTGAGFLRGLMLAFVPGTRTGLFRDIERAEQSADMSRVFEALAAGVDKVEMRRAAPERFRAWAQSVVTGAPVETVFVSAEGLQALAQASTDPNALSALAAALPGVTEADIRAAAEHGTDLAIPMTTWMTEVIGTRADAALLAHVRFKSTDLTTFERITQAADIQKDITALAARVTAIENGEALADLSPEERARVQVFEEAKGKIVAAGIPAAQAESYAAQYASWYARQAERSGMTIEQFLARYPTLELNIDGADVQMRPQRGVVDASVPIDSRMPLAELLLDMRAEGRKPNPLADALRAKLTERGLDPATMSDDAIVDVLGLRDALTQAPARAAPGSASLGRLLSSSALASPDGGAFGHISMGALLATGPVGPTVMAMPESIYRGADGRAVEVLSQSAVDDIRTDVVFGTDQRGDGLHFASFFADVTEGTRQRPTRLVSGETTYTPAITLGAPEAAFQRAREKRTGNFDQHIQTSIPGFYEIQAAVGHAVVETLRGAPANVLDIGASEGALLKTIVDRGDGQTRGVALDPNPAMQDTFNRLGTPDGATFVLAAFGDAEQAGKEAWTEDHGGAEVSVPFYDPAGQRFDVVMEKMVFQFISNARGAQIARVKELMTDDGLAIFEEKLGGPADVYNANEAKKDDYKAQYYTADQLAAKAKEVLQTGGDAVEGMTELQVSQAEMEAILRLHFRYVYQFWSSGNFKGYVASDSAQRIERFLGNLQDTSSEYAVEVTPRVVTLQVDETAKTAALRAPSDVRNNPAFRAWFGNSVLVNDDGSPVVLYHGTPHGAFDSFRTPDGERRDAGFYGQGFYFETSRDAAAEYADEAVDGGAPTDPTVLEVYVRIERPFYMDLTESGWADTYARLAMLGVRVAPDQNPASFNLLGHQVRHFTREATKFGYDGVIVRRGSDRLGEVVAFEPTQVKRTDNVGTFDVADPLLLRQSAPQSALLTTSTDRPQLPTRPDGRVELHHWSDKALATVDPAHAGTGPLRGVERRRGGPRMSFFGIAPRTSRDEAGTGYVKEGGLGAVHHVVAVDPAQLYPWFEDPDGLKATVEARRQAYEVPTPTGVSRASTIMERNWYEEAIRDAGYVGFYVTDDGSGSAPLGNAAALFEAVPVETVYDETAGNVLSQSGVDNRWYYSALAVGVRSVDRAQANAQAWKNVIAKLPGVKKAEIMFAGVDAWLDAQPRGAMITREALIAYIDTQQITVRTVGAGEAGEVVAGRVTADDVYIRADSAHTREPYHGWLDGEIEYYMGNELEHAVEGAAVELAEAGYGTVEADDPALVKAYEELLAVEMRARDAGHTTRESELSLGLPRNLLGTIDEAYLDKLYVRIRDGAQAAALESYYENPIVDYDVSIRVGTGRDGIDDDVTITQDTDGELSWEHGELGSSFGEAQEAIAEWYSENHEGAAEATRWEQYTEPGGTNYREVKLVIDNLHEIGPNAALGRGPFVQGTHYDTPNIVVTARINTRPHPDGPDAGTVLWIDEIQSDLSSAQRQNEYGIITTPFDENMATDLMVKKLLNMAAAEGHTAVAWTPAYMQARRWSSAVRAVISDVRWFAPDSGGQKSIVLTTHRSGEMQVYTDAAGIITMSDDQSWVGQPLGAVLGSGLAKQIMTEPGGDLHGANIAVGAQGFVDIYDRHMRKFIDKWAKPYGSGTTQRNDYAEFDNREPKFNRAMHALSTPDKLRVYEMLHGTAAALSLFDSAKVRALTELDAELEGYARGVARAEAIANDPAQSAEVRLDQHGNAIGLGMQIGYRGAVRDGVAAMQPPVFADRRDGAVATYYPADWFPHVLARRIEDAVQWGTPRTLTAADVAASPDVLKAFPSLDVGPPTETVWHIDVTEAMRVAAAAPQPLMQGAGDRGNIILKPIGQAPTVTLLSGQDLSTLLHEMGHQYLYILQDLVKQPGVEQGLLDDWQTVRAWWLSNADEVAVDATKTGTAVSAAQVQRYLADGTTHEGAVDRAISVGLQEQWARLTERYLMEGRSPSLALRHAFHKFKAWLTGVYKRAEALNVNISPEMRAVFDRMFATQEEIAFARETNGFGALSAKDAGALGVDAETWARLLVLQDEAAAEQEAQLMGEIMAPLRAQRAAETRAARAAADARIRAEVQARPVHRVREWLGNRRWLGDDGVPDGLPADMTMDRAELLDAYGPNVLRTLPRGRHTLYSAKGEVGMALDEVANWFGFASGDQMVKELQRAPQIDTDVKAQVDAEMAARTPDPLTDGTIEELAVDALHGDKAGQLIVAELRALSRAHGVKGKVTPRQMAREVARRTLAGQTVRVATRSHVWQAAERRAANMAAEALARGDRQAAFDAKRQQLINHMLYSESRAAEALVGKLERRAKRLGSKKTREALAGDYLEAIDEILDTYEFRRTTDKELDRRGALRRFVDRMRDEGRENELAIPADVLERAERINYRELTVEAAEGVYDALVNIEHIARWKQRLLNAQDQRTHDAKVDEVLSAFDENIPRAPRNRVATPKERRRAGLKQYLNLVLSASTLIRKVDGQQAMGPFYKHVKLAIDTATRKRTEMLEELAHKLDALYAPYGRLEMARMARKTRHDDVNADLSKWDIISIALNMGNVDNLARLTDPDSRGFTRAQVDKLIDTLDKRDMDFVQGMWDLIDSYWGEIAARERRLTGVAPKKVEAVPLETKHGIYRGGYYPIRYDGELSAQVTDEQTVDLMANVMPGKFGKAQTARGHLEARKGGSGGRPLMLGIEVAHGHLGRVVHDLAYSEAVSAAWRFLRDKRIRSAFQESSMLDDLNNLELWVLDTAAGQLAAQDMASRMFRRLKSNFTLAKLGFNLSTVMVQLTGIAQSIVVVGKKDYAKAMLRYTKAPRSVTREIVARSTFMRHRQSTFNKDVQDIVGDITRGPIEGTWNWAMRRGVAPAAFMLMQKVQYYSVDVPTWIAAYEQGTQQMMSEAEAVAYADDTVARAQAGGEWADRSAFERGTLNRNSRQSDLVRLFTTLGSYMFAKMNVAYERTARAGAVMRSEGMSARSVGEAFSLAADMTLLFVVEAVAYAAIMGRLPDDDDDDDGQTWAGFLLRETGLSVAAGLPFIRDVTGPLQGFSAGGAYGGLTETLATPLLRAARATDDGEISLQLVKSIVNAVGLGTGLPSTATNRVIDGIWRTQAGDDVAPIEYMMGRR